MRVSTIGASALTESLVLEAFVARHDVIDRMIVLAVLALLLARTRLGLEPAAAHAALLLLLLLRCNRCLIGCSSGGRRSVTATGACQRSIEPRLLKVTRVRAIEITTFDTFRGAILYVLQ